MSELIPRSDVPAEFGQQMQMAKVLSESNLLPGHLRGQPANVLLILSGARALDVPAFWSLQSMHVIDGKLGMAAELMRALVIRAGHQFRIVERTRQRAVVEIKRKDKTEPYRFEFDWQDAIDAQLAGKSNWKKYPKAMLVARATAGAVRDECPDVLFGVVYTPDELGAVTDDEGNVEYNDGRVVQMPTPDAVQDYAGALSIPGISTETFTKVWDDVVQHGWALEKVPGHDASLADVAFAVIAETVREAETADEVKQWWTVAKPAGFLERTMPSLNEGDPPIRLGDYMLARGQFLADKAKAQAIKDCAHGSEETCEKCATSGIVTVNLPEQDVVVPPVDTENAQALRQQAAESWGEEDGG